MFTEVKYPEPKGIKFEIEETNKSKIMDEITAHLTANAEYHKKAELLRREAFLSGVRGEKSKYEELTKEFYETLDRASEESRIVQELFAKFI